MFDPDDYELHQAQKHACKMAKERDEARVMVDKLTAELAACAAVLPGAYYMDPPDGGDVPVSEQLRRMAKDAVDEIERMRSALDWYAEMAKTMQRATLHVDNQVALHVMKQMALDGGKKAREAMTHNAQVVRRGAAGGASERTEG